MGEVDERLVCRVCQKVLQNPWKCQRCSTMACSGCWQASAEGDAKGTKCVNTCPMCLCVDVDTVGCHDSDPSVADIIDEIGQLAVYRPQKNNLMAALQLSL